MIKRYRIKQKNWYLCKRLWQHHANKHTEQNCQQNASIDVVLTTEYKDTVVKVYSLPPVGVSVVSAPDAPAPAADTTPAK